MNLTQRALLTPAEVLRINRPYLLVMFSGVNPAMTKAPDLSKWLFNRLLSLGNEDFCSKVRIIRETARQERTDTLIPIWDIDKELKEGIAKKQQEKENERKKIIEEKRRKMEEMKFGHRSPMMEYNQSKIYENIEMRKNIPDEKIINDVYP